MYDIRTYIKETEPLEIYAIVTMLNLCYDTLVTSMMIHMIPMMCLIYVLSRSINNKHKTVQYKLQSVNVKVIMSRNRICCSRKWK